MLSKTIELPAIRAVKLAAVFFAAMMFSISSFGTNTMAASGKAAHKSKPASSNSIKPYVTSKRATRGLKPSAGKIARRKTRRSGSLRGLHPRLRVLLARVGKHYGRPVVVSSGCRSHRHNRRIGGARKSLHLRCMAADFKVPGVPKARLRRYVASMSGRGGVGTYCGRSIVHLDVGPRRTWHHGCRKRRRK